MGVTHIASWEKHNDTGLKHLAYFKDRTFLTFLGYKLPFTSGYHATITFSGPGGIVCFRFNTPLGDLAIFQTHLPLEPMLQRTQFRVYASRWMPRLMVFLVFGSWLSQWRNDIAVWENKAWAGQPLLVKNDGPIMQLRRWYQQFLSASSPVYDGKNQSLDW